MKRYEFIKKWSDFILNETLKTNDIDIVIKQVESDIRLSGIECNVSKDDTKIELELLNFNDLIELQVMFDYLNSLFIDRNGWFPSKMKLFNNKSNNTLKYDENYLFNNQKTLNKIIITYEPKFDKIVDIPNKLYHLSIQEYTDKILKNGLIPKSKNKKTIHLDRIYLCSNPEDCYHLIPNMKYDYVKRKNSNKLNKINTDWIIYEIDTKNIEKLYKDPNYIDKGYYIVDNINPKDIIIYDELHKI
ncbi:hypothetical protein M0Q97_04530 [Candidatus Dojkabacteria bacterium]|jgi:hypothetical protein|nr:hypothetical protein [Candidatus Dojkabacteria bacterium]